MENGIVIPAELTTLLTGILTAFLLVLVTQGLKELAEHTGVDLTGKAAMWTAAIVGAVITGLQFLFSLIPAAYAPFVNAALTFLVTVLGAFGAYSLWKRSHQ